MKSPIFTKRHYRIIAAAIHEALPVDLPKSNDFELGLIRRILAAKAANVLRGTNPNFNEERFIEACLDGKDTATNNSRKRNIIGG